jgi:hypothetical protein
MPQRDEISPERLDALVGDHGTTTPTPEEESFTALMSELRGADGASEELRARVREMVRSRESAGARLVRRLRETSWTQRALAFAPACVLVVGAVFAVSSITAGEQRVVAEAPQAERLSDSTLAAPAPSAAGEAKQAPLSEATLSVIVANEDAITAAGREARTIAAAQGGRTVNEQYARAGGAPRAAVLTLEVPADRYSDTRTALTKIGTISDEITAYRTEGAPQAPPPAADGSAAPAAPTATITVTFTTAR